MRHLTRHDIERLIDGGADPDAARRILGPVAFDDPEAALRSLRRMAARHGAHRDALLRALPTLLLALVNAPAPDRALVNLEHFAERVPDPAELYAALAREHRTTDMLMRLLAGSQFLTGVLLRFPEQLATITDPRRLGRRRGRARLREDLRAALEAYPEPAEATLAMRRFQRMELLRIGAGDLLGVLDLKGVTDQLSDLADVLIEAALAVAARRTAIAPDGFSILAFGKLGGRELNYSSDIDLFFLSETRSDAHQKLAQAVIAILDESGPEGFLYRVDLRLRPWGSAGALVPGRDEALDYLERHARLWEKQALLKARMVAGSDQPGMGFLEAAAPQIARLPEAEVRAAVVDMKSRIETRLDRAGQDFGEVKSGRGSIRDVEFITQFLQLVHGAGHPDVLSRNTLDGLARLSARGILSPSEARILSDGYRFLRTLEHYLQILHNQQTHRLPDDPRELRLLSRRLGFEGGDSAGQLERRYREHREAIRRLYQRYLSAQVETPTVREPAPPPPGDALRESHLRRLTREYLDTFSEADIAAHAAMADTLGEERLVAFHSDTVGENRWRVTIVAFDYLGELSLICGLLFVHGYDIVDGQIFTYETLQEERRPPTAVPHPRRRYGRRLTAGGKRKIVDVLTVQPVRLGRDPSPWSDYLADLEAGLAMLRERRLQEAQGELAKRVVAALQAAEATVEAALPVDIEIDNGISDRYTVMRIDAPDTLGFLYEFTNALTMNGIHISRVIVGSTGGRIHDTLFISDPRRSKLTDPDRLRQLRAATVLVMHFTRILPLSPNPAQALLHFREFVANLFTRPDWSRELASLERPEVLDALARLLGGSDFLWQGFLRMQHENLFPVITDLEALNAPRDRAELAAQLESDLAEVSADDVAEVRRRLNAFKDREMFRIDMRWIHGRIPKFWKFSGELSDLAEVVVEAAWTRTMARLTAVHGLPRLRDGALCRAGICALGKLGGRGIGFGSDIELMFLYEGDGQSDGAEPIATNRFFDEMVFGVEGLIEARKEGIFEIDLRLRPYGKAGRPAVSLEAFRAYFGPDGPAWNYERQALVKLRPIVGDPAFRDAVVAMRDALVYTGEPFDALAMRAMRERQVRQLVGGGTLNAKFSPGGLVDLEYLVQGLQITHGHRDPDLRRTSTGRALAALHRFGILEQADFEVLRDAHSHFRRVIEALRMVRGNARDLTIPATGSEEFAFLARRLGYGTDVERLHDDVVYYSRMVLEIGERLLPSG